MCLLDSNVVCHLGFPSDEYITKRQSNIYLGVVRLTVCVCVCVCACVRACVRVCIRACMRVFGCGVRVRDSLRYLMHY